MILKHFQQPVYNDGAEMTLKFNLKGPAFRKVYRYYIIVMYCWNDSHIQSQIFWGMPLTPHINKVLICKKKFAHQDCLAMSVLHNDPTFVICPGPHERARPYKAYALN